MDGTITQASLSDVPSANNRKPLATFFIHSFLEYMTLYLIQVAIDRSTRNRTLQEGINDILPTTTCSCYLINRHVLSGEVLHSFK